MDQARAWAAPRRPHGEHLHEAPCAMLRQGWEDVEGSLPQVSIERARSTMAHGANALSNRRYKKAIKHSIAPGPTAASYNRVFCETLSPRQHFHR